VPLSLFLNSDIYDDYFFYAITIPLHFGIVIASEYENIKHIKAIKVYVIIITKQTSSIPVINERLNSVFTYWQLTIRPMTTRSCIGRLLTGGNKWWRQ